MRVDRLELYRQLEEKRNSKLLVYVTGTPQDLKHKLPMIFYLRYQSI